MKLPAYSLRTGILSHLTFLIVAAMLLINVVMVKFSERDLIQAKVRTGRLLIRALEQSLGRSMADQGDFRDLSIDYPLKRSITRLLAEGEFSGAAIVNSSGTPVFTSGPFSETRGGGVSSAIEATDSGVGSVNFGGSTWGVIWLGYREVKISEPLVFQGRHLGGITISGSLLPVYQTVRKSEKIILLYIVLDTVILALVGIYLLSRIVVKPVHNLLEMAEGYGEGALRPLFDEGSRNEIAKLSRSLSTMLRRLSENKKELESHISSLQKANEELQQAQNEIIRSEKLASVGRLAAGIAHEIGNPIGIILGYLDLIRKGGLTQEEQEDFLSRIQSEITRVNRIIGQLLDFSRPSSGKPETTQVHAMLMSTVDMLKPQPMVDDILINLELDAPEDTIFADPDQLQQVFLNIMMNAADALSGREDSAKGDSEKTLTIRSVNRDGHIQLQFVDNGPGIPEEELSRILDPFYTTKEPGKGTGLGLSVCYRIVEGLGGTIRAESALGKGTTIIVDIPLCRSSEGE